LSIEIRIATEQDLPSVARLTAVVQILHAALEPEIFRNDCTHEELIGFLSDRLKEPDKTIAVAEQDGAIAGYIFFELQERPRTVFNHPRKRFYVHHISVTPDQRLQGVGSSLMAFVEAQAEAAGVSTLALDSWATNCGALDFFSARGFSPLNFVLSKSLKPG
jgi:ribosomal protein S18 acetylase RimI-like enzyme